MYYIEAEDCFYVLKLNTYERLSEGLRKPEKENGWPATLYDTGLTPNKKPRNRRGFCYRERLLLEQ
jgi:hypothetical protein